MSTAALSEEIVKILDRIERPSKALVTAGMPYANGPLHLGHLAGTIIPADIYARWMRLVVGKENTLFVFGSDDHGSNSEVSAKKAGKSTREFIDEVHDLQEKTLDRYGVSRDVYSGTSRPDLIKHHKEFCDEKLRSLMNNKMLDKKTSRQWFDSSENMFLPDRFVTGKCPNSECDNEKAYSNECDSCGKTYEPEQLLKPVSAISGTTPELKDTDHWWLNMWNVVDPLKTWIDSKARTWRKPLHRESVDTVTPRIIFSNTHEEKYKELKESLPKHKSRYAPGKKIVCLFDTKEDLNTTFSALKEVGADVELDNSWSHRSITRDISWGLEVPTDLDPEMEGKTLYVWPDSLYAPVSFTKRALELKGLPEDEYKKYWLDPKSGVYQFLGQDNNFFYVVMQGALWLGSQKETNRLPVEGELQLTDIFSCFHLQIEGKKMSKSTGNFFTGDELITDKGFTADQLRYFFALLSITEKPSNFEFETLEKRNEFLAGPLNAAFEKPLSAAQKHYDSKIPEGELIGKTEKETKKIIQIFINNMKKGDYSKLLFAIENYARVINGLFTQYKPHDDRFPEKERADALYSSFFILKNLVIMLSPFVPETMEKLRESLNLPESIYSIDELAKPIEPGHKVGEKQQFFPAAD
jgi:methionyl-tRNA synthetase